MFDRVVMVDWSATNHAVRSPKKDSLWLAWQDAAGAQIQTLHLPTRRAVERRLLELCAEVRGRILLGFDFAFGYPAKARLPTGRKLCSFLAARLSEDEAGHSNRFDVAAALNRRLRSRAGGSGPFWGLPKGRAVKGLRAKPSQHVLPEFRWVDQRCREHVGRHGALPQSAWKLFGNGSVGSQSITGLACIGRLLDQTEFGRRAKLWPFETRWDRMVPPGAIIIAEVWPAVVRHGWRSLSGIKDKSQVRALVKAAVAGELTLGRPQGLSPQQERIARTAEGWILGVP